MYVSPLVAGWDGVMRVRKREGGEIAKRAGEKDVGEREGGRGGHIEKEQNEDEGLSLSLVYVCICITSTD